jgi:hypothetical protein
LDFLDRVGWTALQVGLAALVLYLSGEGVLTWKGAAITVGTAILAAIAKVSIGQNTGTDDTGSLIGQPVIEPAPQDTNT